MTSDPIDRTREVELDPEKEYLALVRSLRYTRGFGLLFVQCSPAEGERLISKVQEDLPTKKIEVLTLKEPIDNLYDVVDALPNKDQIDALFVQGVEHSLYEYEGNQLWDDSGEQRNYSQKSIPRLLHHLNLGRERFRDHFKFCFVFLVPRFALKYIIRRAPDFFDWRSGVLEFAMDTKRLQQKSQQIHSTEYKWEDYLSRTPEERRDEILEIQALLEEPNQTLEQKASLYFKQSFVLQSAGEHEAAIVSYDRALEIQPDDYEAWFNRGVSLYHLKRYEEAVASYDRALEIQPDKHEAWFYRGDSLANLGRYEEAVASYDRALDIQYDRALDIQPEKHNAWFYRGDSLANLGRYKEAVASYDRALDIQPDDYEAWFNRGVSLAELGRYKEAVASYDRALDIQPDDYNTWNNRGFSLYYLERYEEAIASHNRALDIQPNDYTAWYDRGVALRNLGRNEEAIANFDRALEIKPDLYQAWFNKACYYALQGHAELATANLKKAIELNPKYREMAKTSSDFDSIRNDDRFQALINAE